MMAEITPSSSATSLGSMQGLKSFVPDEGWYEIPVDDKLEDISAVDDSIKNSPSKISENSSSANLNKKSEENLGGGSVEMSPAEQEALDDEFIQENSETEMSNLARKVAETNLLVDKALGSITDETGVSSHSKKLDELGESLSALFDQLYEGAGGPAESPWKAISGSLDDLSSLIDRRENLREELRKTQEDIDKSRLNLIDNIESVANQEQERLTMIRMRSRLATVMADKLLNKLR
tara:strand:- start:23805 stop:24512 length:708 start_codon:yes stop_codon:yes gene_type:complete